MKIEDIEVGKWYYVVLSGSTYWGRVITKGDTHVIWSRYGPTEGRSLLPQWFVAEYTRNRLCGQGLCLYSAKVFRTTVTRTLTEDCDSLDFSAFLETGNETIRVVKAG